MEESYQQSLKGSSKGRKSIPSMKSRSAGKVSSSMKNESIKEGKNEDDDFERDEDENYSNDFISESIHSGSFD